MQAQPSMPSSSLRPLGRKLCKSMEYNINSCYQASLSLENLLAIAPHIKGVSVHQIFACEL